MVIGRAGAAHLLRMGLATSVALGALACERVQGSDPVAALPPARPAWSMGSEPALRAGELIDRGLWNDPDVLKDGPGYVMYATTSTREMFKPPVLPFRLVSGDGASWRLDPPGPLLDPAEAGFDSCETPSVVRFGGRYHMFYTGVHGEVREGAMPRMAIGHAVSDDGVRWRPDPPGPVLRPTGQAADWNGYLVGEPAAVVFRGRLHLYFAALGHRAGGRPPQRHVIALATSDDGRAFDTPREVLAQSDLYPAEKGFAGYSTPYAVVNAEKIYLFFDVVVSEPRWQQVALHAAVSDDGLSFRQARAPILTRGALSWTSGELRSPSVLFDGDRVRMWFAGHGDMGRLISELGKGRTSADFGIGYAETAVQQLEQALAAEPGAQAPRARGAEREPGA